MQVSHLAGPGCGPCLYDILRENLSLREISLAGNKLGDADVKFIADGLCENFTLASINLSNNDLTCVAGNLQTSRAIFGTVVQWSANVWFWIL